MTLQQEARRAKDCDKFEAAVLQAADDYRIWHEFDASRRVRASRVALRKFDELSGELAEWLAAALQNVETAERQAARCLHTASLERAFPAFDTLACVQDDLLTLRAVQDRAAGFLAGDRRPKTAPRIIASKLWGLLPHHGIKVTVYDNGAAARLLVEIAKAAGDQSITPLAAKKFLQETKPK